MHEPTAVISLRPCPQSFLRMKADTAWRALEGKVAGTDEEYKGCRVTALVALQPEQTCPPGAEPACMLPAEVRPHRRLVACSLQTQRPALPAGAALQAANWQATHSRALTVVARSLRAHPAAGWSGPSAGCRHAGPQPVRQAAG